LVVHLQTGAGRKKLKPGQFNEIRGAPAIVTKTGWKGAFPCANTAKSTSWFGFCLLWPAGLPAAVPQPRSHR